MKRLIRRRPITVMVFNIDDFKRYNDEYSHEAGDEILCETVALLNSVIRRCDRVCPVRPVRDEPRLNLVHYIHSETDDHVWTCLACDRCSASCPQDLVLTPRTDRAWGPVRSGALRSRMAVRARSSGLPARESPGRRAACAPARRSAVERVERHRR